MVAFEISIATLDRIADRRLVLLNTRGRWTAFVKLAEWHRAGPSSRVTGTTVEVENPISALAPIRELVASLPVCARTLR